MDNPKTQHNYILIDPETGKVVGTTSASAPLPHLVCYEDETGILKAAKSGRLYCMDPSLVFKHPRRDVFPRTICQELALRKESVK